MSSKNPHQGRILPFTLFKELDRLCMYLEQAEKEDWAMSTKEDFKEFDLVISRLKKLHEEKSI